MKGNNWAKIQQFHIIKSSQNSLQSSKIKLNKKNLRKNRLYRTYIKNHSLTKEPANLAVLS